MFKVLVVDDTKSVHAFIKSLLGRIEGVALRPAMNGAEAVEIIKQGEEFDLVLLDWEMPIMNGPETLGRLKSLNVTYPVIMMTTKNSPSDIQAMLEAGAAEYIMKPFTVDILFEKISFVTGKELSNAA